jgi:hypothetical protein
MTATRIVVGVLTACRALALLSAEALFEISFCPGRGAAVIRMSFV